MSVQRVVAITAYHQ